MNTRQAYTPDFLTGKRSIGDPPADLFTQSVFQNEVQKADLRNWLDTLNSNIRLEKVPEQYSKQFFIANSAQLPSWANKKLMKAGSIFFARNVQLILNMLGLLSLPYCYTAANGAMVLYLSERMRGDVGKRLIETAEFVWNVMSPEAFEKDGTGFSSILKIRLMHAAVRYYTLKSGKWNDEWGIPVNQEDMAGTNLSFSLVVVRGLRKFGITVSYDEQQSFMHLWNVIGYLLGLDESLLPQTGKQAFIMEEAIRTRQFRVSAHGQELANSLTQYFISVNSGEQFTNNEVLQLMRYLLGDDVADILNLPAIKLTVNKVRLLKALNYLNGLKKMNKDARFTYKEEYFKFKRINRHPGN